MSVSSLLSARSARQGTPPTAAVPRDLTPLNKVPRGAESGIIGVRMMDPESGELLEVESAVARLSRMRRRVHAWAEVLDQWMQSIGHGWRLVMIGLTYADGDTWKPGDIREYLQELRRCAGDGLGGYAWVAETQARGAIHYHVMALVRAGTDIPLPDKSGMWSHGSSKVKSADSVWYLVTYVGKEYQKGGLPKGARMFAVWISRGLVGRMGTWRLRLSALPAWLRSVLSETEECRVTREPGGGWRVGKDIRRSRWRVLGFVYA